MNFKHFEKIHCLLYSNIFTELKNISLLQKLVDVGKIENPLHFSAQFLKAIVLQSWWTMWPELRHTIKGFGTPYQELIMSQERTTVLLMPCTYS